MATACKTIVIFFPQRRRDCSWIANAIRSRQREYIVSVLDRARTLACGHREIWQYRPRRRTSACLDPAPKAGTKMLPRTHRYLPVELIIL